MNNATWVPSYNVRSDGDRKSVKLEYLGSIEQMSGEDWSKVTLSLSTATPSLVSATPSLVLAAPPLKELSIGLARAAAGDTTAQFGTSNYAAAKNALQLQQNEVLNYRNYL